MTSFFSRGTTPGYYRRRGYFPPIVPGAIRRASLPELTFDDIRRAGRQSWRLVNGLPVTHVPIVPVPLGQLPELTKEQQLAGSAAVGFAAGFVIAGTAAAWSAPPGEGFSRGIVAGVVAGIVGGAISASFFKWKQAMELTSGAPGAPTSGARPTPVSPLPGEMIPPGGVQD